MNLDEPLDARIQWDGTEVCIDIPCPCGAMLHFDGWGAYCYRCPHCGEVFELGSKVTVRPITEFGKRWWTPVDPEPDEDHLNKSGTPVRVPT